MTQFLAEIKPHSRARQVQLAGILGAVVVVIAVILMRPRPEPTPSTQTPAMTIPLPSPDLSVLAPLATLPDNLEEGVALVERVRQHLSRTGLLDHPAVLQRTAQIVDEWMDASRREQQSGDHSRAEGLLTLAEKLNLDPGRLAELAKARAALEESKPQAPPAPVRVPVEPTPVEQSPVIQTLSAEQQLVEWLPSLDTVPLTLLKHDFRKGEAIPLKVTLTKPSYLHVFFFQPGEPVVLVYPNAKAPDNRLPPGPKAIEKLIAMPPYGQSWFIAVAETQASNLLREKQRAKAVIQQGYAVFTAEQLLGILRKKSLSPGAALGHVDMTVVE